MSNEEHMELNASAPLVPIGQLYISPLAQPNSTTFRNSNTGTEILRITKDGIYANPDVYVDEAAKAVLDALDKNIRVLVQRAVEAEREECAKVCEQTLAQHYMQQLLHINDEAMLLAACADSAAAIRSRE